MAFTEEEKKIEENVIAWRFWFNVVFSLFLIVFFVYYLPLRFQHSAVWVEGRRDAEMMDVEEMMLGEEMPGEAKHAALYHEEGEIKEGLAVNLNVTPVPVFTSTSTRLDFFVNQKPGNVPVPATALEVVHTKLMHVIGVRDDLNEFFHIHPALTDMPGILSVNHTFLQPGLYKIWSEVKKDGADHAIGHPEIAVEGVGSKYDKQISFGRNAIVGAYQVSLKMDEPVVKGHENDLVFDIHTLTGKEVEVEDYLGAKMHLTVIKDGLKQFIHTHPEDDNDQHSSFNLFNAVLANGGDGHGAVGEDEVISFQVVFPEEGFYKVFAQFRPQGIDLPPDEALTASFWIQAEERAPLAISGWWINLLWSAAAIIMLGFLVRSYLRGAKTDE
ncbi:MAG: hypothetical protein Q8Q41_02525 [bacterium]|nr:hypothetical protein [bacterium]